MSTEVKSPIGIDRAEPPLRAQSRRTLSDRAIINLFIWPTLALLIAVNVFPLFYSLYLSFTQYSVISATPPKIFGGSYVFALVMAANLAAFLGKDPRLGWGAAAGALAAVWVICALGVTYLFERRPMALLAINGGYQLVALTLMGLILAAWP